MLLPFVVNHFQELRPERREMSKPREKVQRPLDAVVFKLFTHHAHKGLKLLVVIFKPAAEHDATDHVTNTSGYHILQKKKPVFAWNNFPLNSSGSYDVMSLVKGHKIYSSN